MVKKWLTKRNIVIGSLGLMLLISIVSFLFSAEQERSMTTVDDLLSENSSDDARGGESEQGEVIGGSRQENSFSADLSDAMNDPLLGKLASVYEEECDTNALGAHFLGAQTFRELIRRVEPIMLGDGNKVLLVPCMHGAYQGSYLFTLFDDDSYSHLPVPRIQKDGTRIFWPRVGEMSYEPVTGIFSNLVMGNGMGTCWTDGEYKVVGRELVLQKFTADWDCEDLKGSDYEGEIVYDIGR